MDGNHIFYAFLNHKCVIKLVGDIRYAISNGLNSVIEKAFSKEGINSFVIDLTETKYIDSTNLGLLAKIARWTMKNKVDRPTIFSNNENVNIVLESMGFDKIFILLKKTSNNIVEFETVVIDMMTNENTKKLILEAHQTLMMLNEQNRQKFSNVVELLEQEVNKPNRTQNH